MSFRRHERRIALAVALLGSAGLFGMMRELPRLSSDGRQRIERAASRFDALPRVQSSKDTAEDSPWSPAFDEAFARRVWTFVDVLGRGGGLADHTDPESSERGVDAAAQD